MNKTLWDKIKAFPLDEEGVIFPFSARLARDNGWSREFALRVVEEYKKFIYLCAEAGHSVTPSDEVDQAWHLHLCYTKSYWEDLCGRTLGKASFIMARRKEALMRGPNTSFGIGEL